MLTYLYIALGGAIGSTARFALSSAIANGLDEVFPWGTLVVNVTGCFLIGIFAVLSEPNGRFAVTLDFRQFFMVGVCGGYTTFSSFGLQTLLLARDGEMARASLNVLASVIFCLAGVWLGLTIGHAIGHTRSA